MPKPSRLALTVALLVSVRDLAGGESSDRNLPPAIVPPLPAGMELATLPRQVPDPTGNPRTLAKVALGRLLFFDPVLSSTRDVSCATCHDPRFGWADGRPIPIGVGGNGRGPRRLPRSTTFLPLLKRNTPSLLDVGFTGLLTGAPFDPASSPLFWDARVAGLEAQALVPLQTRGEMCGADCGEDRAIDDALERVRTIPEYVRLFHNAFPSEAPRTAAPSPSAPPATPLPDPLVSADHLAQALAAFERTLKTASAPIDRFLAGDNEALTVEQREGLRVFRSAGCQHCHGGPMFSDFKLHFIGTRDGVGGSPREFRTPTLRNLRWTAPYFHDGSLRTLRDVLVFYDGLAEGVSETLDGSVPSFGPALDPLLREVNLNPDQFPALEAFLQALASDNYDRSMPPAVPSGLPVEAQP